MVFNSFDFLVFLPIVFLLYWLSIKGIKHYQNYILIIASLIFYGWADLRFLALILINSSLIFWLALQIENSSKESKKRILFWIGVIFNIGTLLYFKYFNFFIEGFETLLSSFGMSLSIATKKILIPLGISFYTFQTLGYLIDTFNEEHESEKNYFHFLTFVSFFPKLLAGPIERAHRFLPQIQKSRIVDHMLASEGLRQILWGLFKKSVIADNITPITTLIFNESSSFDSPTLLLGTLLYSMEVYCDFSGYSDMAVGVSKLFGIRIINNFGYPFFAQNISDFWRRWHISLSTWMMDYVFTPMSFLLRNLKKWGLIISIISTFIIVGLWHGPKWTYILFGLLHGFYFIPTIVKGSTPNKKENQNQSKISRYISIIFTYLLVALTMVVFKYEFVTESIVFYKNLFAFNVTNPGIEFTFQNKLGIILTLLILTLFIEWKGQKFEFGLQYVATKIKFISIRWGVYFLIILLLFMLKNTENQFIYFQF